MGFVDGDEYGGGDVTQACQSGNLAIYRSAMAGISCIVGRLGCC